MTKKILYTPPRGIGDLIFSLPLINSIKAAIPDSEIEIAIANREGLKEILNMMKVKPCEIYLPTPSQDILAKLRYKAKLNGDSNAKFEYEKKIYDKYFKGLKYDIAIVPKPFSISTIIANNQVTREDLMSKGVDWKNMHMVDGFLAFADLLKIPKLKDFSMDINKNPIKLNSGLIVDTREPYVIICLGASEDKRKYSPEKYSEVVKYITDKGLTAMLVGTDREYDDSLIIEGKYINNKIINLISNRGINLNLREYTKLAKQSNAVICGDTGLLHIADAVGVKVIGLYGPASEKKCGPYNNMSNVISRYGQDNEIKNIKQEDIIRKLETIL